MWGELLSRNLKLRYTIWAQKWRIIVSLFRKLKIKVTSYGYEIVGFHFYG